MKLHDVAIVGATGIVGRTMVQVLQERAFPVNRLVLLASERSTGKELDFNGTSVPVQTLSPDKFRHCEFVLFFGRSDREQGICPPCSACRRSGHRQQQCVPHGRPCTARRARGEQEADLQA